MPLILRKKSFELLSHKPIRRLYAEEVMKCPLCQINTHRNLIFSQQFCGNAVFNKITIRQRFQQRNKDCIQKIWKIETSLASLKHSL